MCCLFASFLSIAQPDNAQIIEKEGKKYFKHIVAKGETAYGICRLYNIELNVFFQENPTAENGLNIDQVMYIPVIENVIEPSILNPEIDDPNIKKHVIKSGETIWSLSRKYSVSVEQIKKHNIDFVIVNGENAAEAGVGLTKEICEDFFKCGVDVITTGNHVWDQKDIMKFIDNENRLLRPKNLFEPAPGKGFEVFQNEKNIKIGVLNLMGNVFMKKCDDVFETSKRFIDKYKLKEDYDFLVVDFHGEITSEKNAIGHFFDGKATLVVGTHTHIPTNDARILKNGTAYQTDAGMCGDYNSVIGMNKENSMNKFFKKDAKKHFPSTGVASLSGVILDCDESTGLAKNIEPFICGGDLKNTH